jgi:hypothetical protein
LCTLDDINFEAIDTLLDSISSDIVLSSADSKALVETPDNDTILKLIKHCPKGKSPGLAGLPIEVYQYLALTSQDFCDMLISVLKNVFLCFPWFLAINSYGFAFQEG